MVTRRPRASRTEGDVVRIDLGGGWRAYARVLREPLLAFYDLKTNQDPAIEAIVSSPIAFKIWVMNSAITSGRWSVIGHDDLAGTEPQEWFCKEDPLSGRLSKYSEGEEVTTTFEECSTLERAAVWEAEHVEDRLRDHFKGRPNKWVDSLRLKPRSEPAKSP